MEYVRAEKTFYLEHAEELTHEVLLELIQRHERLCLFYRQLENMYKGYHDILYQKREENSYKPDNRLVVNYAKYIVDTLNGYFMGIPVKTTCANERANTFIQNLEKRNNIDDSNAELSKKCSIYGHAFELVYMDEEAQVGVTYIEPTECFVIYDTSIREIPLYGIRYTRDKENRIMGTISDAKKIQYFTVNDKGQLMIQEEVPHYFQAVPIVEYMENEERQGAFEHVMTLIDGYNKAISEKANDVDYFADAYMKILGAVIDEETLQQIKRNRVINMPALDTEKLVVEFMEKPNADQTQENLINRLEKLIFQMSMVANINEESFGTTSGIALKYKLQSMSNLANTKERKFVKGFNQRFQLIANLPIAFLSKEDVYQIQYLFTRNIPNNLKEEAEIATDLSGLVSEKTMLKTLSIVDDPQAEMEQMKEENTPVATYDYEREEDEP